MWPKPKDSTVFRLPCLRVNRSDVSGLHMSQTSHGSSHKAGQDGVHLNMLQCIPYGSCARHVDHSRFSGFVGADLHDADTPSQIGASPCANIRTADGLQIPACNGSYCGSVLPRMREIQTKASARCCIVGTIRSG
jgi:hypothetical protein